MPGATDTVDAARAVRYRTPFTHFPVVAGAATPAPRDAGTWCGARVRPCLRRTAARARPDGERCATARRGVGRRRCAALDGAEPPVDPRPPAVELEPAGRAHAVPGDQVDRAVQRQRVERHDPIDVAQRDAARVRGRTGCGLGHARRVGVARERLDRPCEQRRCEPLVDESKQGRPRRARRSRDRCPGEDGSGVDAGVDAVRRGVERRLSVHDLPEVRVAPAPGRQSRGVHVDRAEGRWLERPHRQQRAPVGQHEVDAPALERPAQALGIGRVERQVVETVPARQACQRTAPPEPDGGAEQFPVALERDPVEQARPHSSPVALGPTDEADRRAGERRERLRGRPGTGDDQRQTQRRAAADVARSRRAFVNRSGLHPRRGSEIQFFGRGWPETLRNSAGDASTRAALRAIAVPARTPARDSRHARRGPPTRRLRDHGRRAPCRPRRPHPST